MLEYLTSIAVPEFSLPAKTQEEILGRYHPDVQNMLDLEQIFPYLNQHKLLTNSDQEVLQSPFYSRNDKITRLVMRLHIYYSGVAALITFFMHASTGVQTDCLQPPHHREC